MLLQLVHLKPFVKFGKNIVIKLVFQDLADALKTCVSILDYHCGLLALQNLDQLVLVLLAYGKLVQSTCETVD